jgi:hypothetical protein
MRCWYFSDVQTEFFHVMGNDQDQAALLAVKSK